LIDERALLADILGDPRARSATAPARDVADRTRARDVAQSAVPTVVKFASFRIELPGAPLPESRVRGERNPSYRFYFVTFNTYKPLQVLARPEIHEACESGARGLERNA